MTPFSYEIDDKQPEIKTEYFSAKDELGPIIEKLLTKFGKQESTKDFLQVSTADFSKINLVWFNPTTVPNGWVAKTIKTPPYYTCLGVCPLTIICVKSIFDFFNPDMVKAVLFHELMHIGFDDKGKYKLVSHDIQDFKSLVKEIGLEYEKAEEMFKDI